MAEPREESEGQAQETLDQASPAAVALALGKPRPGARLPPEAAAFLLKQTRLIDLQTEHLHEQRELQTSRLRLGRWKDRISLALQAMTAVVGLVVVIAIAAMAWQAHQDHGVAIEAFSVPPDLAQRGLTGQVVASELLDRLSDLQAQTVTARPASTYANDWGGDIKVEIPETGVSIGELNRWLREWLGSQTRITGEVVRTPTGLAVTARAGQASGRRFDGTEADLDKLVGQAAEAVYAQTQPYRHAVYLTSHGRADEALAAYQRLAASGAREDRPWAYAAWGVLALSRGDSAAARALARKALTFGISDETGAITTLFQVDHFLSHWEAELEDGRLVDRAIRAGHGNPRTPSEQVADRSGLSDGALGDYRWTIAHLTTATTDVEGGAGVVNNPLGAMGALARSHDLAGARRMARKINTPFTVDAFAAQDNSGFATFSTDDWPGVETFLAATRAGAPRVAAADDYRQRFLTSALANAASAQGRQAEAEALIAQTPLDCDICVDGRAVIAARMGDWAAAARWMALLERRTPSIPFAPTEWGRLLLDGGDVDASIAELRKAHQLGPHFADPLEIWGEALMKKGDFAGAVGKFREADTDAPRWGRNHLRWGQALARLGKADEAKAQFQAAAGMDLSVADRAELARAFHG